MSMPNDLIDRSLILLAAALYLGALSASLNVSAQDGKAIEAPSSSVASMKDLIEQSLASGAARGWVDGDMAMLFNKTMERSGMAIAAGSSPTVFVAVKKLSAISPECGRVQMDLSRPGMTIKAASGAAMPAAFSFNINVCSNGAAPPAEEMK